MCDTVATLHSLQYGTVCNHPCESMQQTVADTVSHYKLSHFNAKYLQKGKDYAIIEIVFQSMCALFHFTYYISNVVI